MSLAGLAQCCAMLNAGAVGSGAGPETVEDAGGAGGSEASVEDSAGAAVPVTVTVVVVGSPAMVVAIVWVDRSKPDRVMIKGEWVEVVVVDAPPYGLQLQALLNEADIAGSSRLAVALDCLR